MNKQDLRNWVDAKTQHTSPLFFCVDPSNNQPQIVAMRNGDGWENAGEAVEINMDRFSQYIEGKGFWMAARPQIVGGYQYYLFAHIDDSINATQALKLLQQSAQEHDQGTVAVEADQDLFAILERADPATNRITFLIQIRFAQQAYTLTHYRYQGQNFTPAISPIRLSQAVFDSTLRSAGWVMVGVPSHQVGSNLVGDQYVANNYHFVLERGQGINQINKATDLQEWQAKQERIAVIGRAVERRTDIPDQTMRAIASDPAKLAELEAIRDL